MLNQITIMGRLTAAPELRRTQNDVPVSSFRIAVDRDRADADGERKADFISVTAWRGTAEFVSNYFAKGSMTIISGRLQIREWTDRNGNKKSEAEVVADRVYFGEKKAGDTEKDSQTPFMEDADDGNLPF